MTNEEAEKKWRELFLKCKDGTEIGHFFNIYPSPRIYKEKIEEQKRLFKKEKQGGEK